MGQDFLDIEYNFHVLPKIVLYWNLVMIRIRNTVRNLPVLCCSDPVFFSFENRIRFRAFFRSRNRFRFLRIGSGSVCFGESDPVQGFFGVEFGSVFLRIGSGSGLFLGLEIGSGCLGESDPVFFLEGRIRCSFFSPELDPVEDFPRIRSISIRIRYSSRPASMEVRPRSWQPFHRNWSVIDIWAN